MDDYCGLQGNYFTIVNTTHRDNTYMNYIDVMGGIEKRAHWDNSRERTLLREELYP